MAAWVPTFAGSGNAEARRLIAEPLGVLGSALKSGWYSVETAVNGNNTVEKRAKKYQGCPPKANR